MIITEVHADGFRNLEGVLECATGINILCGDNAQGKTNWLEAIYVLGNTKSFRTAALREALRIGADNRPAGSAILRGQVLREHLFKEIQLHLEENLKSFYVNGKRETVVRYLSNLDVLVFCAEEMQIIRGEPSERRRFLDRGIVTLSPTYLKVLSEYNRVLKQKNVLLKDAQQSERRHRYIDLIEPWNEQLLDYGTHIHNARVEYTERLRQALRSQLFSEREIDIRYRSSLEQHGDTRRYRELFQARLQARLENEIAAGYALVGPHRDELEVLIEGLEVSKFGSAGEQRSALITLDLAQITVYNSSFEEYPVFLIDDIDAELDARRISLLLEHVADKMQVFVSTSKRDIVAEYQSKAAFRFIQRGRVMTLPAALPKTGTIIQPIGIETDEFVRIGDFSATIADDNLSMAETPPLTMTALSKADFEVAPSEFFDDPEDKHRAPF
ncbi:MAG: DNA replication and repair protein RecF [Acidobacteriota bacterium]